MKGWVYLIVFFVGIAALVLVLANLVRVNSECVSNPLVYGANNLKSSSGDVLPLMCTCNVNEHRFSFDKDGMYSIKSDVNSSDSWPYSPSLSNYEFTND